LGRGKEKKKKKKKIVHKGTRLKDQQVKRKKHAFFPFPQQGKKKEGKKKDRCGKVIIKREKGRRENILYC